MKNFLTYLLIASSSLFLINDVTAKPLTSNNASANSVKSMAKKVQPSIQSKKKLLPNAEAKHTDLDFWFYRLDITTENDHDFDGFANLITVTADLDTAFYAADIYLEYQLSDDNDVFETIYTSEVFSVYSESEEDALEVTSQLNEGWFSEYYTLRVLVIDAVTGEVLYHTDHLTHPHTEFIALESLDFETGFYAPYIFDSELSLRQDSDADSHFSQIKLELDIDTQAHEQQVYLMFWLTDDIGNQSLFHESGVLTIYSTDSHDQYKLTKSISDQFGFGYYNLSVDIMDADTNEIVSYNNVLSSSLALESQSEDIGNTSAYVAKESQGGSLLWLNGLLALVMMLRRKVT